MICPKCGSNDVDNIPVTHTTTTEDIKGFDGCNACCGYLLFGWVGILCGLCGMGEGRRKVTHTTKIEHVCRNCGKRF